MKEVKTILAPVEIKTMVVLCDPECRFHADDGWFCGCNLFNVTLHQFNDEDTHEKFTERCDLCIDAEVWEDKYEDRPE